MAHADTTPLTTSHEIMSRTPPISRSRASSQTRSHTHAQSSSSFPKTTTSSSLRSPPASQSHSRPIPPHPVHSSSSSSMSASSSTSIPPVPRRLVPSTDSPSSSSHTNPAAARHNAHHRPDQQQNPPRSAGDRMERKDQRRGDFNMDRRVLSEAQGERGSLARRSDSIHKQMKKDISANGEKHSILSTAHMSPSISVAGASSGSNSGGRSRTTSEGSHTKVPLSVNANTQYLPQQQPYPRIRTVSDGRGTAPLSGRDPKISLAKDPYFKAPGAPSSATTSRAVAPQPHPQPHSQSELPTTNLRDGSIPITSGSGPSFIASSTGNSSSLTAPGTQRKRSVSRKPPPSMEEASTARTPLNSQPPSSSSAAVAASSHHSNPSSSTAPPSSAALSSTPARRPSLASPLPPSPIVPISFPRQRSTPAPLNLGPAAIPASAGASSSIATPSPRPRTGSAGAYQNQLTPTSHSHTHIQNHSATSTSWTPSSAQYVTRPSSSSGAGHVRPGSSSGGGSVSHPDSPSASAMMRRLLSKPAPVTSPFCSSGASGSESESKGPRINRALGGSRTSGSESEGPGIVIGRRAGHSASGLGRAATASAVFGGGMNGNARAGPSSSLAHGSLRRKGSAGSTGSGGKVRKTKRTPFADADANRAPNFDFEFSDVDVGSIGIKALDIDLRRKETYAKMEERSFRGHEREARAPEKGKEKEKEKEKRSRNVLRRRPSAPAYVSSPSTASSPSVASRTPPMPVVMPPVPKSPPPPAPSERLPALAPFSPLTLSPTGTPPESRSPNIDTTFSSNAATHLQPHVSSRPPLSHSSTSGSSKGLHRSTSAAAGPPSPRRDIFPPHSRTASHSPSPAQSPRRSAFMTTDSSAPVALSPSANIAVSISPRRSAFVLRPDNEDNKHRGSDAPCAPSGCAPVPIKIPPSGKSSKEPMSPRSGTTPAASLAEAYKRQEAEKAELESGAAMRRQFLDKERALRERELRAVERQQAMILEERGRADRGRRHSEDTGSALRPPAASTIGRSRTLAVTHLSVQEQEEMRSSVVSTHTNASFDSLLPLRVRAARSGSTDALNAGSGFAAIERLAGRASPAPADALGDTGLSASSKAQLRKSDHFDVKPTSPRAFDGVERNFAPDAGKHDRAEDEQDKPRSPEPYYTVFGGLGVGLGSGRGRAGDNPDTWADVHPSQYAAYWDVPGVLQAKDSGRGTGKEKEKERSKESLGRTLSRKVSGHWRKQASGGVVKDTSEKEDGERSRRRLLRTKSSMAALNARQPSRAGSDADSDFEPEKDPLSWQPLSRTENKGDTASTPSPGGSITGIVTAGAEKVDKGDRAGGGRFWKLMKRISVGGLKERFKDDAASAPPVPALPSDYRSQTLPSGRERLRDESLSPPAPSVSTPSRMIPRKAPPTPQTPASPAISLGLIANTSSSSPMSTSDVASSKFFAQPHSPRSSTSSIGTHLHAVGALKGDEPPPLPKLSVNAPHTTASPEATAAAERENQHTAGVEDNIVVGKAPARPTIALPPHTQTFGQDWTIARTPSVELVALPLPPMRRPPASTLPSSSSPLAGGAASAAVDTPEHDEGDDVGGMDRAESPTIPSFSTSDTVNNFKPTRRSIGSSLKSTRSRESPVAPYASPITVQQRSRSQPASPASARQPSSSFIPPFMRPKPSPSSSSSSLVQSGNALQSESSPPIPSPPPRPVRSAQRPSPVSVSVANSSPSSAIEITVDTPQADTVFRGNTHTYPGRKSESAIRDMPSSPSLHGTAPYTQHQRETRIAHHRRSSDALSSASTARPGPQPHRQSTSYQLSVGTKSAAAGSIISVSTSASATSVSPPPSAMSTLSFGPVSPGLPDASAKEERRPLTEEEKAARWEDLLERSAQAGGTLHIAGGARVLASDRLRFGRRKK